MTKTIKLTDVTVISDAYKNSGVKAATKYAAKIGLVTDWLAKATSDAAEANYARALQAAIANKTRAKEIAAKTTNESWKHAATTIGVNKIGIGITNAAPKQAAAWKDYYAALQGLVIADKVPDDPVGNLTRNAGKVVATLVNVKRAKLGLTPIPVP